jgi:hypothetical protein
MFNYFALFYVAEIRMKLNFTVQFLFPLVQTKLSIFQKHRFKAFVTV